MAGFRKVWLGVSSVCSAGLGAVISLHYDKWHQSGDTRLWLPNPTIDKDTPSLSSLPLPIVSAASPGGHSNLPVPPSGHPQLPASIRTEDIMRFGFPGFDNVRSYGNFVISYNNRNRTANWVFERLSKDQRRAHGVDRDKSEFQEDSSIHPYFRSSNYDYRGSGFDRGHLAAAGNHHFSQKFMDETFVLSNICPQVGPGFNRDAWNQLEKFVRQLTKTYSNVYVCTGPLFLPKPEVDGKLYVKYEVIGKNHVAVPTHFFKVLVMEKTDKDFEMLCFVMPNQVLPLEVDLRSYLVPLESIERAAGFLLFPNLPRHRLKQINGRN